MHRFSKVTWSSWTRTSTIWQELDNCSRHWGRDRVDRSTSVVEVRADNSPAPLPSQDTPPAGVLAYDNPDPPLVRQARRCSVKPRLLLHTLPHWSHSTPSSWAPVPPRGTGWCMWFCIQAFPQCVNSSGSKAQGLGRPTALRSEPAILLCSLHKAEGNRSRQIVRCSFHARRHGPVHLSLNPPFVP